MYNKPNTSLAVTLPELMTTVCVSGVLAAVAVPNFVSMITENQTTNIANQLVTALAYTRSEAIKRGYQVTMKHKGATERVWEQGWDIFTDRNGNGVMDTTDELLMTYENLPQGYTLRSGGNYSRWVAYLGSGRVKSTSGFINDTFDLCDSSKEEKQSRSIIVKMGRVRTEKGKVKECP
jgi:type IV fimbrial biogenesis protein FimT